VPRLVLRSALALRIFLGLAGPPYQFLAKLYGSKQALRVHGVLCLEAHTKNMGDCPSLPMDLPAR